MMIRVCMSERGWKKEERKEGEEREGGGRKDREQVHS
jgi:hypothetical protein